MTMMVMTMMDWNEHDVTLLRDSILTNHQSVTSATMRAETDDDERSGVTDDDDEYNSDSVAECGDGDDGACSNTTDVNDDDMRTTTMMGPPKLPVDREWLQKLLHRHVSPPPPSAVTTASETATTAAPYDSSTARLHLRAYVLAPMVDQSDLPFRLQCRRYGTNLCYTPMIHAKLFATTPTYRAKFQPLLVAADRPLIAQLCGSNVDTMLYTALAVAPYVDAIDINCGCPQSIAKRGVYGAFLLEQEDVLLTVVRHLLAHLSIPLTVKVRLLPPHDDMDDDDNGTATIAAIATNATDSADHGSTETIASTTTTTTTTTLKEQQQLQLQQQRHWLRDLSLQRSLALYTRLVDAGIHLLTVHGRTRFHKGVGTGAADWDAIRCVVEALGTRIPIFANGSIATSQDVVDCLQQTRADGVMSSEAILEYPPLFAGLALVDEHNYHRAMTTTTTTTDSNKNTSVPLPAAVNVVARIHRLTLALEYLTLATHYPPDQNGQGSGVKCCKVHLHRFLHADLQNPMHTDIRTLLVHATSMDQLTQAVQILVERRRLPQQQQQSHQTAGDAEEQLSWYFRHRHLSRDCFGITVHHGSSNGDDDNDNNSNAAHLVPMSLLQARMDHERNVKRVDLIEDAADCFASLFDES